MNITLVRAPNPGPFTLTGTNSWVLDGSVIIDPGPVIDSHLDALLAAAPALTAVVVTHRHADHAPAAAVLGARPGVRVFAPPGCLPQAQVDEEVVDGAEIVIDTVRLQAIATPGHTDEHVCYLTPDGALFTGDTVLGEGTTTIFPPDGRMGAYLDSLRRLLSLQAQRIYPGHGPIRDDVESLLNGYIEHRIAREKEILQQLESRALTIPELRQTIYAALDPRLDQAAESQLFAHLELLREKGAVVRTGDRFAPAG